MCVERRLQLARPPEIGACGISVQRLCLSVNMRRRLAAIQQGSQCPASPLGVLLCFRTCACDRYLRPVCRYPLCDRYELTVICRCMSHSVQPSPLFHRAIVMSAGPRSLALDYALAYGAVIATEAGCVVVRVAGVVVVVSWPCVLCVLPVSCLGAASIIECMRAVPAESLIAATERALKTIRFDPGEWRGCGSCCRHTCCDAVGVQLLTTSCCSSPSVNACRPTHLRIPCQCVGYRRRRRPRRCCSRVLCTGRDGHRRAAGQSPHQVIDVGTGWCAAECVCVVNSGLCVDDVCT